MLQTAIGFTLGALVFQHLAFLPSPGWLLLLPPAIYCWWKLPFFRLLPALVLGLLWSLAYAWITRPAEVPAGLLGQDIQITGHIQQIPRNDPHVGSFLFQARQLSHAQRQYTGSWLFRLSWYEDPPELVSGDQWRLTVKLKQAHGFMNPGGFDYEGWLYEQGIRYTGYVRGRDQHKLGSTPGLHRMRQAISTELAANISHQRAAGVVRALVVGDRNGLGASDRKLFAATGTSHLMAISGLHVGLVAGILYAVLRWIWIRIPLLCRRWPARVAAAPAAILGALAYAALAGFSVPTQRALIMLSLVMTGLLLRHNISPMHTLFMALLLVVAWNPLALVSAGLWLSFVAVSIILISAFGPAGFRWLKLQFLLALGLLPILLAYQMDVALFSPLVNLIAIPLFGVLIVPTVLLASLILFIWPIPAVWLLELAAKLLLLAMDGLQLVADISPAWGGGSSLSPLVLVLWFAGLALLIAPRGLPGRWLGITMLLPLLLPPRQSLAYGQFYFTLLDVGQGLSAVVETSSHTLVFDTGPRFRSGFETGSKVVAPYLQQRGVAYIDILMLSHGDIDHTGGARGLLDSKRVGRILAGEPDQVSAEVPVRKCSAGGHWQWDGVDFSIVYPATGTEPDGNNASCVLKISNGAGSVLLTGDLEKVAERQLAMSVTDDLAADVVVAPHHGSASSSSPVFIRAVAADHVLYSAGFNNRWGFPDKRVVQRWAAAGASSMSTAESGAIQFHFGRQLISQPSAYREYGRRWFHHP